MSKIDRIMTIGLRDLLAGGPGPDSGFVSWDPGISCI